MIRFINIIDEESCQKLLSNPLERSDEDTVKCNNKSMETIIITPYKQSTRMDKSVDRLFTHIYIEFERKLAPPINQTLTYNIFLINIAFRMKQIQIHYLDHFGVKLTQCIARKLDWKRDIFIDFDRH